MTIGIIGAMEEEISFLVQNLNMKKHKTKEIYETEYNKNKIIISKCGIGKVNSASMTQYLIDTYNLDIIINTGCAGSLQNKYKIFDIIISTYVTYHDFTPTRIMKYSTPDNGKVTADSELIEIVVKACSNMKIARYYKDAICCGDSFVTSNNQRDLIFSETGASAVDMESGSIGHVSKLNNVPFVCIRTISDFADGKEDFEKEAGLRSSKLVKKVLDLL